ncbi:MAG: hypothetical protein IIA82_09660 [Thaumarchaeota archaeon]|nr:hypothetical protein [Nitrososphaerota archaeon]
MVKPSIKLKRDSKKISLDLAKWIQDARTEDLITIQERDEFENCAARIAGIGNLFT